ncbi:MAG: PAS-domain containing protein [Alphaproteobacteria bacterium]
MADRVDRSDLDPRRQLEAVLDQIAEGVNIVDKDMNLVLANTGFLDMFGFPHELGEPGTPYATFVRNRLARGEFIGAFETSGDHSVDEMIAERVRGFGDLGPTGERVKLERRPGGQIIELRRRRLPDGSVISTHSDVTERVAAIDALKESEARYRVVVEDQSEMICRFDCELILTFANRAYWQAFKRGEATLVGLTFLQDAISEADRQALIADLGGRTAAEPTVSRTVQVQNSGGLMRWHHWTFRALDDGAGTVSGFQAVGRDVTGEREAQAEIERQRTALAQNDKMSALGSILASVSHELNNPLAVVVGLNTTGIEPLVTLDDDLPELFGDAFQIGQVLVNLLINAQQALVDQPKPRLLSLRSRRSARGDKAIVTIADNGPGVADDIKRKIFEPFFTTKTEGTGTGIGLAISHNIVAAHGGQLGILDTPGGGATFEIRIPIPDHVPEPNAAFVAIAEAVSRRRSARILIVDDEIDIATTIADYLAAEGHACQIATGGKAALAQLEKNRFDAVISDIRMPDIDGPALYEQAQTSDNAPPFGFVTGDTLGASASVFLRTSGLPHIEKPFSREQIVALANQLLMPSAAADP